MGSATIVSLFLSSVCLFPLAASLERSAPRQDMSSYLNMDTVWISNVFPPRVVPVKFFSMDGGWQRPQYGARPQFVYLFCLFHPKYRVLLIYRKPFPLTLWKSLSLLYLFWTDISGCISGGCFLSLRITPRHLSLPWLCRLQPAADDWGEI